MEAYLPLILFVALILALMLGYPVALTLGGVSIVAGLVFVGPDFFDILPLRIYGTMQNTILIAVPLFVFMGVMLEKSGIAERLLKTMSLLMGRVKGGLALSVIIVGAMLAASTGVVGATVVTMGLLSLPVMLKQGYSPALATGTIAASGTLGQIIPPSVVLVLLGSVMSVDVGKLFMGALVPSLMLVVGYMIYVMAVATIRPKLAPPVSAEALAEFKGEGYWKRIVQAFVLPFLLILSVLGSIFTGMATPTEAAGLGAFVATVLTILEGKFNLKVLKDVMRETTFLSSMVFIILVGASAFGLVFREFGGDDWLIEIIHNANLGPYGFLLFVMVAIFIAGFFIDFIEIIFIFIPVVTPIFMDFGMDLSWIAVLIALNLQTSFLTPPFGFSLFYLKGVAPPEVTTVHMYKGIVPFVLIQLLVVLLVALWPGLLKIFV
jgi:tripartite ATP-independent transporter DctM subunit